MAIKKRITRGHKSHFTINKAESHQINQKEQVLEKIILALFLVFVIIATMILFRAPVPTPTREIATGKAIASIDFEKTEYNASEKLKGTISLQMEQGDVLPKETKFEIFISTNVPNCQLKYICPNGVSVDWHTYDSSTGACDVKDPDPESTCCFLMGPACLQVILNSKFNDVDLGSPNWYALPFGTNPAAIGVENLIDPTTSNVTLEKALFLDSTDIAYTLPNVTATAYQLLLNREFAVKEMRASEETATIVGPKIVKNSTNVTYNATMFLWGQPVVDAQYTWSNSNNEVGTLNATSGRFVTLVTRNPGWTTITVTATAEGRTATTSKEICVYITDPEECWVTPEVIYLSESNNIEPKLKFNSNGNQGKELYFQAPPTGQPPAGQNGVIKWSLAYTNVTSTIQSVGCAFEVIVKGKNATNASFVRTLHYWYKVPTAVNPYCNKPQDTPNDKYIDLSSQLPLMTKAKNFSFDLYSNWTSAFGAGSQNDIIYEIHLVSRGAWDQVTNAIHGQRVYFDNVELRKYSAVPEPSLNCTARGKVCCVKGSGLGTYLGKQLSCPEATRECYERCAPSLWPPKNFEDFKAMSSTSTKFNRTEEKCKVVVEGAEIDLRDYCYRVYVGEGYTACIDTGNTTSTPTNCRGWDNKYIVSLNHSAFHAFNASAQNGTYALTLRLSYNHTMPENCSEGCLNYGEESCADYCVITEISAPFTVGAPPPTQQCPDTDYNCYNAPVIQNWSSWTECINGQQSRTRVVNCTYVGTQSCDGYRAITQIETQTCNVTVPCTENDYSCDSWTPELCSPQSTQTRSCTLITTCDPTAPGATEPAKERTCDANAITEYIRAQYSQGIPRSEVEKALLSVGWSKSEIESIINTVYGIEEKPSLRWLWIVIIVLVVAAAIIVVIAFVVPKAKKGKPKVKTTEAYPELTSYIKDALATGATKQEITAKLQEAGWPKDAIEESFKAVG